MDTNWLFKFSRRILFSLTRIALIVSTLNDVSHADAKSAQDISQISSLDRQKSGISFSTSDSCGGPVIYLSGVTTSRYTNNSVANGTTLDRTTWYSDAVGNGTNLAFSVGNGDPPPSDVCIVRGVINGHIPLDWTWDVAHNYGVCGDKMSR